jgi:esterase/lipase superfamily enzyme
MRRRVFTLAAALLVASMTAGCGGRATGVMRPVNATAEGATKVPLLVATTRRASPDDGLLFSGERGGLSFAKVTVSIPPGHKPGEIEWPDRFPGDPAKHFVTTEVERFDRDAFRNQVRQAVANRDASMCCSSSTVTTTCSTTRSTASRRSRTTRMRASCRSCSRGPHAEDCSPIPTTGKVRTIPATP